MFYGHASQNRNNPNPDGDSQPLWLAQRLVEDDSAGSRGDDGRQERDQLGREEADKGEPQQAAGSHGISGDGHARWSGV